MSFRDQTTFNRSDTRLHRSQGRITVVNDVKTRCNRVLDAIAHLQSRYAQVFSFQIRERLQATSERGETYTKSDVQYALRKCIQAGFVECRGYDDYRLTFDPSMTNVRFR